MSKSDTTNSDPEIFARVARIASLAVRGGAITPWEEISEHARDRWRRVADAVLYEKERQGG